MILDSTLLKLEAVLAGAVAANQPEVVVDYFDYNRDGNLTKPATFRVALNSTTDVTILAAPRQDFVRDTQRISIYNKDTASVTVTVKTDDGTTERILIKATLLTLETLNWEKGLGWYALDANGNRKEVTSSVFSSITIGGGSALTTYVDALAWTPADGSGAGLSLTVVADGCIAYRIGGMVYAFVDLTYPATADGTTAKISGLPYTCKNTTNDIGAGIFGVQNAVAGLVGNVLNNTQTAQFVVTGTARTNAQMSGAVVRGCFIYPV